FRDSERLEGHLLGPEVSGAGSRGRGTGSLRQYHRLSRLESRVDQVHRPQDRPLLADRTGKSGRPVLDQSCLVERERQGNGRALAALDAAELIQVLGSWSPCRSKPHRRWHPDQTSRGSPSAASPGGSERSWRWPALNFLSLGASC